MIESIGSRVLTPTLQKTKDGAPFSQIGTGRSKAGPPAFQRFQVYSLVRSRHGYLISPYLSGDLIAPGIPLAPKQSNTEHSNRNKHQNINQASRLRTCNQFSYPFEKCDKRDEQS